MKKIGTLFMAFVLVCSVVLAQGNGNNAGQDTGETVDMAIGMAEPQQTEGGVQTIEQGKLQEQNRVESGTYSLREGKQIQVQRQENNKIQLRSGIISAQTTMNMTEEQTQDGVTLKVKMSNGKNAEVKIMPDTASERALERLRLKVCSEENGCHIELKEVGQGDEVKAAYEVKVKKQSKVLGVFKKEMAVEAQVDAGTGEVIKSNKPWWAFTATESEE